MKHMLLIIVILILSTVSTVDQLLTDKETGHSLKIENQKYLEKKIAVELKETEHFQSKIYNK